MLETPCKIPRPIKRRRVSPAGPSLLASLDAADDAMDVVPAEPHAWAGHAASPGSGNLDMLAQSFAMVDAVDIVRCSAVCRAWHTTAESGALWTHFHFSLARRIVVCEVISRRLSRGRLVRGMLLGPQRQAVALRTVCLSSVNARSDDGLLPSILREVALLKALDRWQHPGVVRLVGAEVSGEVVHIATEFMPSSFADWFGQPRPPLPRLRAAIRGRFLKLSRGVAFLHSKGVIHRNLSPHNVLLNPITNEVKLSDFSSGRHLEVPVRSYSPEDYKMRQQSAREMRRMYYRAPERVLRHRTYAEPSDMWSVGCLLAEACRGVALFPSEGEVDHLFRTFRLVGTPSPSLWPEALTAPQFSPQFPLYEPIDMNKVWRVWSCVGGGSWPDAELTRVAQRRPDAVESVIQCGQVLGLEGLVWLNSLLQLDPAARCTAEASVVCPFLRRDAPQLPRALARRTRPRYRVLLSQEPGSSADVPSTAASSSQATTSTRLHAGLSQPTPFASQASQEVAASQASAPTPGSQVARQLLRLRLTSPRGRGGLYLPVSRRPLVRRRSVGGGRAGRASLGGGGGGGLARPSWGSAGERPPPLWQAMEHLGGESPPAPPGRMPPAASLLPAPRPPAQPGAAAAAAAALDGHRLEGLVRSASPAEADALLAPALLDGLVALAGELGVGDLCLHLAAAYLVELAGGGSGAEAGRRQTPGLPEREAGLVALVCLKLADTFDEHSQEYYQCAKTATYEHTVEGRWSPAEIIAAEKQVVQRLDFRLHRPTAVWFLRTCVYAAGPGLKEQHLVLPFARFAVDLALLDPQCAAHPPPLRAQVAFLLALCLAGSRHGSGGRGAAVQQQDDDPMTGGAPPSCRLPLWAPIRRATCGGNSRARAQDCLERMTNLLFVQREKFRDRGLLAVERKHPEAARHLPRRSTLAPDVLPANLVEELLPWPAPAAPDLRSPVPASGGGLPTR